jgi:hypothetical protein
MLVEEIFDINKLQEARVAVASLTSEKMASVLI